MAESANQVAPRVEDIRSRIEETRATMSGTIDAIHNRLTPSRLLRTATRSVQEATVGRPWLGRCTVHASSEPGKDVAMIKFSRGIVFVVAAALAPQSVFGQSVPTDATPNVNASQQPIGQQAADRASRSARRFGAGLQGGVGLDPEIVDVGAHLTIGPIFKPALSFRPGVEIGAGELTTLFAINLDVLYALDDNGTRTWTPYLGAGPSFGLSHRGFSVEDSDNVTVTNGGISTDGRGRFDFSDTDFNGGMNFIAGVRKERGMFLEMKATAWGVSNIRLLAGFNF
jgi:hypothetical protein